MRTVSGLVMWSLLTIGSGCVSNPSADGTGADTSAGKADAYDPTGFVGVVSPGRTVQGFVGGDSVALYRAQLGAESEVTARVARTSGDLRPSVYLYSSLDALGMGGTFDPPEPGFEVTDTAAQLRWITGDADHAYFFVVAAREGTSGGFELELGCASGDCVPAAEEDVIATLAEWVERYAERTVGHWRQVTLLPTTPEPLRAAGLDATARDGLLAQLSAYSDASVGDTDVYEIRTAGAEVLGFAAVTEAFAGFPTDCPAEDDCGTETASVRLESRLVYTPEGTLVLERVGMP